MDERHAVASAGIADHSDGVAPRVFLQPIAAAFGHPRRRVHYGSHGWTEVAGWVFVYDWAEPGVKIGR